MGNKCKVEGQQICEILDRKMSKVWDGKACILELQKGNYQWRQMEWIGWYNEFRMREITLALLGGSPGPRFGNTAFDYRRDCVWDFKVHPAGSPWTILNDQEAIDRCIVQYGAVGFVITLGIARYDDGTFQLWHDALKGSVSGYVRERIARGARSRRRKAAFEVTGFLAFMFDNPSLLTRGLREGWLAKFQEGMRNANGSPRRPKYMVNVERIPSTVLTARLSV